MYMGLGVVVMIFGFMYFLTKNDSRLKTNMFDKIAFIIYTVSLLGLSGAFLTGGAMSTPRRFATHFPEWMGPDKFGAISGIFVILTIVVFVIHFIRYIIVRDKKAIGTEHIEGLA